jgi:hypothetical protein
MEIFSEVGAEPYLKITGQSLTFNGEAGASQLESEDLIFFDDASPPAPSATFSARGIDFENEQAEIQSQNDIDRLSAELYGTELRLGQSRFTSVVPPALSDALYEDFVNKIVAITNIDSKEFNRNNDTNTSFNWLCTSADASSTGYTFSDNHVISSLAAKNLIDAKDGVELEDRVVILEEWMDD